MPEVEVCRLEELPPGTVRVLPHAGPEGVGVYNCGGELLPSRTGARTTTGSSARATGSRRSVR